MGVVAVGGETVCVGNASSLAGRLSMVLRTSIESTITAAITLGGSWAAARPAARPAGLCCASWPCGRSWSGPRNFRLERWAGAALDVCVNEVMSMRPCNPPFFFRACWQQSTPSTCTVYMPCAHLLGALVRLHPMRPDHGGGPRGRPHGHDSGTRSCFRENGRYIDPTQAHTRTPLRARWVAAEKAGSDRQGIAQQNSSTRGALGGLQAGQLAARRLRAMLLSL